ncbi:MAG: type II secretion system minor pseudopilin GspJ, partial [Gammaproteobacteria bacterium]|nr:type II secretion system minor pseudopilin GspJ [Gammaproteobacteria bacterium]
SQQGFTLLELIVAMAVFAILSAMAYEGLQSIMNTKVHTEAQTKRLVELQTAFLFIGRDIEQSISRSVRDGYGDVRPALQGGEFGTELLALTRAGRTNFLQIPRSNLQRVAYQFEDDNLYRLSWPMLDQDFAQEPQKRKLLHNLKRISFRYLDDRSEWQDQWPAGFEETSPTKLPKAVEVNLEFDDIGTIRRLFLLAPGESAVGS